MPYLGENELPFAFALLGERKAVPVLLEGQRVVAEPRPKSRIAGLLTSLTATKKGGEG